MDSGERGLLAHLHEDNVTHWWMYYKENNITMLPQYNLQKSKKPLYYSVIVSIADSCLLAFLNAVG